jgi:hypothetical protein
MAIALVSGQFAHGDTGAATAGNFSIVLPNPPTAGSLLAVAVAHASGTGIYISTTTGISWMRYQHQQGGNTLGNSLWIGRVFSGASATITVQVVSGGSNNAMAGVAAEFSGTSMRIDQAITATASSTSAASGATATTTSSNELWIGSLSARCQSAAEADVVFSAPTNSFTLLDQRTSNINTANADRAAALLYKIVSSTGTANAGATIAVSNNWIASVVTFCESGTNPVQVSRIHGN